MKKELVKAVLSLTAAKVAWQELGREFELGDRCCGKVGIISSVGRVVVKATAATIAYSLTDATIESVYGAFKKNFVEKENEGGEIEDGEYTEDC